MDRVKDIVCIEWMDLKSQKYNELEKVLFESGR